MPHQDSMHTFGDYNFNMQTTVIDFSNSFRSKQFVFKMLGLCVGVFLITFLFFFFIHVCYICIHGDKVETLLQYNYFLYPFSWWCILFVVFFPYNISLFRNQYQIREDKLYVKEYCFFIPTAETTIPLDKISKVVFLDKIFLSFHSKKLKLTIDGKEYVLRVQNHAKELNQYIQQYITSK